MLRFVDPAGVVKHSGATTVVASISKENEEIHVSLSDNGKGFDTQSEGFKAGIGLSSIRQRASMIGADVQILSQPGSGTIVELAFKPHD